MSRPHISREERRSIIIKSAKRLIVEQGIISFKFSELSKISFCSNSTIYDYFNSKEDVIVTIFNENLNKLLNFNNLLLENKNLSYKEMLLISSSHELISNDSRSHHNVICNFFAINQFVCDHADPYISSESCRLLKRLRNQTRKMLNSAISSGELSDCSDDALNTFQVKLISTHRGLVALTMNKFKDELEWSIDENLIFNIIASDVESLPWTNKETVSQSKIYKEQLMMKIKNNEVFSSEYH